MSDESLILLVEDREDDVTLIQKAFEKAGVKNPMQVVRDGEKAVWYLAGEGEFANRAEYPLPWLVLLDLKMPRVDGFEVLAWIRKQPWLKKLGVIVLTSSEYIHDVNRAYQLGANSFLVKPLEFEDAVQLSKLIEQYWLRHNRFAEMERTAQRARNLGAVDNQPM